MLLPCVVVQLSIGLWQRNELRLPFIGIEHQNIVQLRQPQISRNLWCHRRAIRLFLQEFRIDSGSATLPLRSIRLGVSLLPFLGRIEIDERGENLFFRPASFRRNVPYSIADHAIAHYDLIAAVLQNQAGTVRRACICRRKRFLGRLGRGRLRGYGHETSP